MEYKQTRKQVMRPWKWSYILLSTIDMGTTQSDNVRKHKTDDKKNKRQKQTSSSTVSTSDQNKNRTNQKREPPEQDDQSSDQYRLPRITMSNVRSLPSKMEELSELVKNDEDFRNSDLMFFTETWLKSNSEDIDLDGFSPYRADRDAQQTGKRRGGGLIMFVNEDWATNVQVKDIKIKEYCELMVVTIRPHDHPFPLTFIHVYVPGPKFDLAANDIEKFYDKNYIGGPVFVLGDFNQCDLSSVLGYLEQYVTCPTRKDNTLDKCYGNIPGAYRSQCRPPLGKSDHNVIHLIPKWPYSDKKDSKDDKCDHTRR